MLTPGKRCLTVGALIAGFTALGVGSALADTGAPTMIATHYQGPSGDDTAGVPSGCGQVGVPHSCGGPVGVIVAPPEGYPVGEPVYGVPPCPVGVSAPRTRVVLVPVEVPAPAPPVVGAPSPCGC